MAKFTTTNIRIHEDCLQKLKMKAVREKKSTAQLIREAIDAFLGDKEKPQNMKDFKKDPFFRIVGLGSSGIRNGSVNHDKYLYKKITRTSHKK